MIATCMLPFWPQLKESSHRLHELGLKVEMRSSPENYIAWKGGKGQAATRDTEIISTTLCATCPLFSVFFLKQIQTFQSTVYWAALRRCRLPLHSVSAFNFLNREKIRRKRNSDSNSLSEYPTTFLYTSYSTSLASIQGCYFPFVHRFFFFQAPPIFWIQLTSRWLYSFLI